MEVISCLLALLPCRYHLHIFPNYQVAHLMECGHGRSLAVSLDADGFSFYTYIICLHLGHSAKVGKIRTSQPVGRRDEHPGL